MNPFELLAKVRFLLAEEGRRPPARVRISRDAEINAGEMLASASLMNLSGSGALIETDAAGDLDGEVVLRFSLPDSTRVLEPLARVVRRTIPDKGRGRIALEFKNLDGETRRALESFLFLRG